MSGPGQWGERPLEQRPAARPQVPHVVYPHAPTPAVPQPPQRPSRGMVIGVWIAAAALVLLVAFGAVLVVGYGVSNAGPHYPTTKCLAAFDRASEQLEEHFRTHPSMTSDAPTDEEIDEGGAIWDSIEDPLLDACTGVEDFYQAAYAQGEKGAWGLRGTAAISDAELRDQFIWAYCEGNTHRSSCSDYEPKNWP